MSNKISVAYPIEIGSSHSNIDFSYGPYESIEEALAALTVEQEDEEIYTVRGVGLTIGIKQQDGSIKEYWFKSGITDEDLVEKTAEIPETVITIDDLNLFYEYSLTSEEGKEASEYLAKRKITLLPFVDLRSS